MRAFDFFCGAGGLTRGLLNAGIDVVAGFDVDRKVRQTYESNNPSTKFVQADICDLTVENLRAIDSQAVDNTTELLFAGCAPCQPFSKQRRSNTKRSDATILGSFGKLVEAVRPGQVLIENVPGMAKVPGYSTFRRFLKMLERTGYLYAWGVVDAKNYGVPQNRARLILIAMQGISPTLPPRTHGPGLLPYRTVQQVIGHFPPLEAGEIHPEVPNHVSAAISSQNLERLRQTPHDGGDRRSWQPELQLDCHQNIKGYTDVYGRMHWGLPAPALTGRCNSISNGRFGHPEQDRAISLREAAAIQTFPDDYVFYGYMKDIALHIGNAVPVSLGQVLGEHILKLRA